MVKTIGNNGANGSTEFSIALTANDETSVFGIAVVQYVGIVYLLARKYAKRTWRYSWDDAFQDGMLGMLKAYGDHDASRGKLSTLVWTYAKQAIRNGFRTKTRIYGVVGNGKDSFETLYNAKKEAFKANGYDLRMIRGQGIESLESIVPKGVTIYYAGETHSPIVLGDCENSEWTEPTSEEGVHVNDEDIEHINFLVRTSGITTIEAICVQYHMGGMSMSKIAELPQVNQHIATKMGVLKAIKRGLEKLQKVESLL